MMTNREIKFRAWDTRVNEMINPLRPVWFEENNYHHDDYAVCAKEEGFILMQYTGLKDKNGVEIYEGDIVRRIKSGNFGGFIGCVGYYYNRFICPCKNAVDEDDDVLEYSQDLIEVIGNAYESPNLLSP